MGFNAREILDALVGSSALGQAQPGQAAGQGGLGDLLGQVVGGLTNGTAARPGGGSLSDILGQLAGAVEGQRTQGAGPGGVPGSASADAPNSGAGGGLGDILGQLTGGQPGGGSLADILGQLTGGGQPSQQAQQPQGGVQQAGPGGAAPGGLGDILGQLTGGQSGGGLGGLLGGSVLGGILGQVLGGGAASAGPAADAGQPQAGQPQAGQPQTSQPQAGQPAPADSGEFGNIEDALGRIAGGQGGGYFRQALDFAQTPQGMAILAGLAGLVLGTKSGRAIAGSAAKLGGIGLIGGLAYKAIQGWQTGADPAATQAAPALPAPDGSGFEPTAADDATAVLLLRAMIAASAADGHVDDAERQRIVGGLGQAGVTKEAVAFLDAEFARPATPQQLAETSTGPETSVEIYTAARLAIDPDTPQEQAFLAQLRDALGIDPQLVAHIDAAALSARA